LKASPVGELKHLRAIDLILCCCISIINKLPLLFDEIASPKAPESVKKIFPVVLETINE
jgi:hypothetical protein